MTSDIYDEKKVRQVGTQEVNICDIVKPITKYSKLAIIQFNHVHVLYFGYYWISNEVPHAEYYLAVVIVARYMCGRFKCVTFSF